MNFSYKNVLMPGLVSAGLMLHSGMAQAQFNLPGLPKMPNWTIPSAPASSPDSGGNFISLGFCALVGVGAAALAKKLAESEAKRLRLSPQQAKAREQSYMLGWALAGCAVGGGVAANVIKNMSESARKAQEEAWRKAQQQTGPVGWTDPNNPKSHGSTAIVEREKLPDGSECGTRRDVIEAEEGTAEPMQRVCRTAGTTEWKPVVI